MIKIMVAIFFFALGALATLISLKPVLLTDAWSSITAYGSTSVAIATAVLAAIIASWGIFSQRAIARRVYTVTYLSEKETDKDAIEARNLFIEITKSPEKMASAAKADAIPEHASAIRLVLNDFELIAIGIQRGVIDFKLYEMWNKTNTINSWRKSEPFIHALRLREGNDMIYHEFENLVKWLEGERKPKRGYIVGHWFW